MAGVVWRLGRDSAWRLGFVTRLPVELTPGEYSLRDFRRKFVSAAQTTAGARMKCFAQGARFAVSHRCHVC